MKNIFIGYIFLLSPAFVYADEMVYKLSAPLPAGSGEGTQVSTFIQYIGYLFPFLLFLASILALVMFTLGAIQYMFSEGASGNQGGKEKMTSAILGLLLAAGSVIMLETINPELINLKIDTQNLPETAMPDVP